MEGNVEAEAQKLGSQESSLMTGQAGTPTKKRKGVLVWGLEGRTQGGKETSQPGNP